ncbi:hypothetical protein, partial [Mesotoga sp. TolDC]|uniref:hypothetical protein n=2 Tax=Mesotoga TaxID=1184396 RepID=UPI0015E8C511
VDPEQIGKYVSESILYIENTLSTESIYYNKEMSDLELSAPIAEGFKTSTLPHRRFRMAV